MFQGPSAEISLKKGNKFRLTTNKKFFNEGDENMVYIDYTNITKVMHVGGIVFIDDGLISLKVVEKGEDFLLTEILNTSKLGNRKGVNLPNCEVDLPAVSEQDEKDINFGKEMKVHDCVCT